MSDDRQEEDTHHEVHILTEHEEQQQIQSFDKQAEEEKQSEPDKQSDASTEESNQLVNGDNESGNVESNDGNLSPPEREQLDDLPTEIYPPTDNANEPSSTSQVVERHHIDTQTHESNESHSEDHSPHSSSSTPRDHANNEQVVVVSETLMKRPPRQSTIDVTTDDGLVHVEIQRDYLSAKRAFLGGYRGHKSGRITLHASTQTARRRTKPQVEKSERTTQTVATIDRAQQTFTSVATQMDRRDWCPINDPNASEPIYIEPRPAVSAETIEALRDSNARAIQCWLRVCFAHRRKAQLQAARVEAQAIAEAESSAAIARRQAQQAAQIERRMHPQSTADFALLQSELQAWRAHETQRIQSLQLDEEEKDKQLATLLSKEVKLLQTIDRLKLAAAKQRKAREVTERLKAMSSPLEWSCSALDEKVHVITPNIERAKAMVDLYRALQLPLRIERTRENKPDVQQEECKDELQSEPVQRGVITWEDRLDILLHVKYTAKEQLHTGSKMCAELVKLIEREEEWMTRRMLSPAIERVNEQGQCVIMDGTRTRIASLFLQLINDPTFNPHVAQFPTK